MVPNSCLTLAYLCLAKFHLTVAGWTGKVCIEFDASYMCAVATLMETLHVLVSQTFSCHTVRCHLYLLKCHTNQHANSSMHSRHWMCHYNTSCWLHQACFASLRRGPHTWGQSWRLAEHQSRPWQQQGPLHLALAAWL